MYLNVEEVESALEDIAGAANAAFTEHIELPEPTWEQRTCHAIRIHDDGHTARTGVFVIGGVHAREWGSPDILIHFAQRLADAYRDGTGITEGGAAFDANDIARIVRILDVVVFPQVNPDGRHYSMTESPLWRKNRRPAEPDTACVDDGYGGGPGVDINRNYDFLHDFGTYLSPDATLVVSDEPCDPTYHGASGGSEPETRNVKWLANHVGSVEYLLDVHSFGEWILYPWGDDEDQSDTPTENFRNAAWDGRRGVADDNYGEHVAASDLTHHVELATAMFDGIKAAHGREYKVEQSSMLNAFADFRYITTGTAHDWAFSRHLIDPSDRKIYGYTVEWGPERADSETSFHPDYPDMVPIIEEVTAGLLSFCLEVADRTSPALEIDPGKWALVVYILFGVTNDGGGVVIMPGTGPIPVDPWGPLRRLTTAERAKVLEVVSSMRPVRPGSVANAAEAVRAEVENALGRSTVASLRKAFVVRPELARVGERLAGRVGRRDR